MIELLVVISIITILACLLFPSFQKVKEKGKAIFCTGNLRQIGTAFGNYADDYNGHAVNSHAQYNYLFGPYPYNPEVEWTLCPYLGDPKGRKLAPVSKCPSGRIDGTSISAKDTRYDSSSLPNPSYEMSQYFVMRTWGDGTDGGAYCSLLSRAQCTSLRMVFADWLHISQTPAWDNIAPRHLNGANILFLDMHVKYYSYNEILNLGSGADAKNQFWHNDRQ